MNPSRLKSEFCKRLESTKQITALFDHLPDIYFFGKCREGRFVFANLSILNALGFNKEDEIIGKSDFDLFDSDLAEKYRVEDRLVMASGEPLTDQVWLVPNRDGTLHWYLSSKRPLFDQNGEVIGIAGVMRDFDRAGSAVGPYRKLSPVLAHVQDHFREEIPVQKLADLINVSVSTLERTFKTLFGISPTAYIMRVRLHAARRALRETNDSINEIALDSGFYDQSHFTKKFRAAFGKPPSQYRKLAQQKQRANAGGV